MRENELVILGTMHRLFHRDGINNSFGSVIPLGTLTPPTLTVFILNFSLSDQRARLLRLQHSGQSITLTGIETYALG